MKLGRSLLSLLLLALLGSTVRADATLDLRPRFAKGDVHRMNVILEQALEQTVRGHKQVIRQRVGVGYSFTVLDVTVDGSAALRVKYNSTAVAQKSPYGQVEYDSAHPPRDVPPPARGMAALVGQTFTATVTPSGRVTDIKGMDAVLKSVLEKMNLPEGPARAASEKLLRQMLSAANVRSSLQGLLAVYPGRPVAMGDTWNQKTQVDSGFPLVMETSYTLKAVQGGAATIALHAKASSNSQAPPVDLGQAKLRYDLTGEQIGTIAVGQQDGWIREADFDQTLTGTMKVEAPNAPVELVPTTVHTTTRMTSR